MIDRYQMLLFWGAALLSLVFFALGEPASASYFIGVANMTWVSIVVGQSRR